jgi:hypothetical protein
MAIISSLEQEMLVRWMSFNTQGLIYSTHAAFVSPADGLNAPANG